MEIRTLQLHKRSVYRFENIQDKFAVNKKTGCFALADGTTQSFYSEKWAETITAKFVSSPTFNCERLIKLFTDCVQAYKKSDFKFSPNPAKASLEKAKMQQGGTATFMGIQITKNKLNIISSGDTNLFHISGNKQQYFPYSDIESLDGNKHFINTERLLENKIDVSFFQSKTLSVSNNDLIIVATDALSRLFLKKPQIISEFISITVFDELHKFCLTHWEQKELEEDDISAIIIKLSNKDKEVPKIKPPSGFSFPEEAEEPFVPTSLIQQTINPENNINMQEIRGNFNGVKKDLRNIKKTLLFQQMLMFVLLGLITVNVLITNLKPKKENKKGTVEQIDNRKNKSFDSNSSDKSKTKELREWWCKKRQNREAKKNEKMKNKK